MSDNSAEQLGCRESIAVVQLADVKREQPQGFRVGRQRTHQHVLGIGDQRCERLARQPEADEAGWRWWDGHAADLRARHQHGFTRAELDLPTALRCVHAAACGDR